MQGKIVKGIAGFYYVHAYGENREGAVYECKARGVFRKDNVKPLVGDNVEFTILDEAERKGNIVQLLPRKNTLIRPAVANVDQALVIFAMARPEPNLNLLDRFLIQMEKQKIPSVICFNKKDIVEQERGQKLLAAYQSSGYPVLQISAATGEGTDAVRQLLQGKTTTVAGPSGVGKSSLINQLAPRAEMETGEVSRKIQRGRHTTRHTELFAVGGEGYILDTPGFSSLGLFEVTTDNLWEYYQEFAAYEKNCRFAGCAHIHEPDCGIKQALAEGRISGIRYDNYVQLYEELKNTRKYQ